MKILPKPGQFVCVWLVDHSALGETVLVLSAGMVSKVSKKTLVIDHWYSEGLESEWKSAIDLRTVELIKVIELPDPPVV
jgi:hypothetical protein